MSKRIRPQPLGYDEIKNSPERHTSHEAGKQLLVNLMNAGELAATFVKLSLKCKLKKGRIEVPVRSVHCLPHPECVDLRNYLAYQAKNSATIDAPRSTKKSQRPLWACPICGERARTEDLRVDDYFAHILESFPASVGEVQLNPDGTFEQLPGAGSDVTIDEVTIDNEEPCEPQPEHLHNDPSGPGQAVEELLKQSKAFQGALQSFKTKKDLLEKVEPFLGNQLGAFSALLNELRSTNEVSQNFGVPEFWSACNALSSLERTIGSEPHRRGAAEGVEDLSRDAAKLQKAEGPARESAVVSRGPAQVAQHAAQDPQQRKSERRQLDEQMDTQAIHTDQEQPQRTTLAPGGDEPHRAPLRQRAQTKSASAELNVDEIRRRPSSTTNPSSTKKARRNEPMSVQPAGASTVGNKAMLEQYMPMFDEMFATFDAKMSKMIEDQAQTLARQNEELERDLGRGIESLKAFVEQL